jgi:ribosomal protein S18 acetylase RimI-like enzyme
MLPSMTFSIRRLGPGDEEILALLGREDADFDVAERGGPLAPLAPDDARAYLADPGVLHWIAQKEELVVGFMYCHLLRKRAGEKTEILLYEIGVRGAYRRQHVGRALIETLHAWMNEHQVREAWVLADNPDAVEFYRSCGFEIEDDVPVYMTRGGRAITLAAKDRQ